MASRNAVGIFSKLHAALEDGLLGLSEWTGICEDYHSSELPKVLYIFPSLYLCTIR